LWVLVFREVTNWLKLGSDKATPSLKPGFSFKNENGVFVDQDWRPDGVTDQFLADAVTYHERYTNNEMWTYIMRRCLWFLSLPDLNASLKILDVGSGSGNTVFPLATLLPKANIVATDISPQLTMMLAKIAETASLSERITCYCVDFHKDVFADSQFDLVCGGAILHHMLDPKAALVNVAKWVKPGGSIVLVEPMEAGAHLMSILYLAIVDRLEGKPGADKIVEFSRGMIPHCHERFGPSRVKPWTESLDDKWFFDSSYLRMLANEIRCTVAIHPLWEEYENMFENFLIGNAACAGISRVDVHSEAIEIAKELDAGISEYVKRISSGEAVLVFKRER
jgi:2-polyprenyl-3-methyl-5-hydroxy-6-metoxy-1,4-benzoquinol methylase